MPEKCPKCGKPINKEANYCGYCGFLISGIGIFSNPTKPVSQNKKKFYLLPVIVFFGFIFTQLL
ncbi:MAG TPA: zinc ribbon domain-containing protein, partial [Candidatus Gallacutalibacter pullicola]|nr:zinc ribbon domain-containing protein [Candidatus Gallacutalibacter pullicola]